MTTRTAEALRDAQERVEDAEREASHIVGLFLEQQRNNGKPDVELGRGVQLRYGRTGNGFGWVAERSPSRWARFKGAVRRGWQEAGQW